MNLYSNTLLKNSSEMEGSNTSSEMEGSNTRVLTTTTTLKMISHSDREEIECGNCHTFINIIDMGEDEEGCNTHACMVKQHYTKLVIVGCGTNCVDCKGYADWYKDEDGYIC